MDMMPRSPRALWILVLAGTVRAGQIEAPVSGQNAPGRQTGAIGSNLGAPVPVQLTVPSLTGIGAPRLQAALSPTPSLVQPVAVQAAVVPALPVSAVTAAKPKALAANAEAVPSAPAVIETDAGRAMFDQGGASAAGLVEQSLTPRTITWRSASRGEGWEVDGKPAQRLSGGSFKDVLIHPSDQHLVIKIFTQFGADDTAGSLSERRRESRNLRPLLAIRRAPRVVEEGVVELNTPSGKEAVGYVLQRRVDGRGLGDMLRDRDPAVRASALDEVRALFEELITARIKLEVRVKMRENVFVGREGGTGASKAWVLDAEEVSVVPRGLADRFLGRPDPLRAYYDAVLADLVR